MPKEDTDLKCTLPDGSRVFGEDGTISFLANGKVAVGVGGPAFEKQKKKVISRFNVDPVLLDQLEAAFQPPFDSISSLQPPFNGIGSELLQAITQITDQAQFDRRLDTLVGTLRAIRELQLKRFNTPVGKRFIDAVRILAIKHIRPPTKKEITNHLCCDLSQTSKWCKEHGFAWLPNAPAGRHR